MRGGEDVSRQTLGKGWGGGRKETECAFLIRQLWVSEIRKAWGGDCVSVGGLEEGWFLREVLSRETVSGWFW